MASTYSDLKIELIGTGEQTGTWGTTTNNNFSVAFQEAITGSADVAFSSADVTVTLTDTNTAQTARNLRLNLTGTSGGARNLILGSGCQIEKLYLINNGLADAVTVKNTSGTGIAVAAGKSMFVFNNGTNVVDAVTYLSSLTLGTDLAVADGGTGSSTLAANAVLLGNGTSALQTVAPSTSGNFLVSNGTTWTSATLASSGVRLGLGITGEVWSDVNGTYAVNTNYTNNYGYPIAMTIEWSNGNKSFTVNGVLNASASGAGGNTQTSMFIIIPTGAVWQLVAAGGGINRWTQLS